MIITFFYLSSISILIGAIIGLLSSLLTKHLNLSSTPVKEQMVMLSFAYLSYLVSDQARMSPIISMFSCGLFMSHYTFLNVSEQT